MKKNTFHAIQFLAVILLLGLITAFGQEKESQKPRYIIKGDKLEKVENAKEGPVKTSWTIEIKDTIYPVWKGTKGSYFVIRTSKKTGKEYRQYLKIEGLKEDGR